MVPVPPTPDEFVDAVMKHPAPTFTLLREEFKHMLPTKTWPEMVKHATKWFENMYKNDMEMTYTVSDLDAINAGKVKNGKITEKKIFFRHKMNTNLGQRTRYISTLMSGYILTGEKKYRDRAAEKARQTIAFYDTAKFFIKSLN